MTFLNPLPWWVLAALVAAAVPWAWLAAGGTRPMLTQRQRAVLTSLRLAVALLLLVIFMRPAVMAPPSGGTDRAVAVLVDGSRSMNLVDDGGATRFDRALELTRDTVAPALQPRFAAPVFSFGESLQPLGNGPVVADAPRADLDAALLALPVAVGAHRLAGAVVLSDGGFSWGAARHLGSLGVPVAVVGIGAREGYRDREVTDVSLGDPAFAESTVDLTATVVSRGLDDRALDVTVLADGVPVAARRVALAGDGAPARATVEVRPAADRAVQFTVRVGAADGELTTTNNEASVLVPPTRRRARVLLVEGAPGFEHSFLKRALERDPALAVDAVVPKGRNDRGDATFYVQAGTERAAALVDGWPGERSALFAYDAVVLANASLRALSRAHLGDLTEFVSRRGGGLVTVGADAIADEGIRGLAFADVVPLDPLRGAALVARASRTGRPPGTVWLTPEGEDHPAMRLPGASDTMGERWMRLPRLSAVPVTGRPRPGASVLAMVVGPAGESQPLVTVQRYGRGRVLAFTGEASWRWRMMLPSEDMTYETFWRQVMRWVAAPAPGQVELAVSEPTAGWGDVVVDVRDPDHAPVSDARVVVSVGGPSGDVATLSARPVPAEPGRYRARFGARAAGLYRATVEVTRGSTPLGSAEGWLLAGAHDREMRDPRRNDEQLRQAAESWGGEVVEPTDLGRVAAFFDRAVDDSDRRVPVDVWHTGWVMAALIALFCLEWALRRRWGLR